MTSITVLTNVIAQTRSIVLILFSKYSVSQKSCASVIFWITPWNGQL